MGDVQITVQSATRSLVVNKETYSLTKIPDAKSELVQAAMQEVLRDLSLATVLTDLDRASDLIYLAYNGVAGMGVLAASVSSRQKKLGDLCAECVVTMTAFRQGTQDILGSLIEAFENLLEAEEEIALEILADCGKYAKKMSEKCGKLASGFDQLKTDTQKDSESAEIAVGKQVEKLREIKKLRDEMNATLAEQKKNSEELIARVEELKQDIAEAKQEEAKESERAFIGGMVGALAGAVGAGLGAFAASQNPIGTAVARMTPPAGGSVPPSGGEVSPEKVAEAQAKKDAAEKAVREKQAAVDLANQKLEAATKAVEAAQKELETKKDAAKKARDSGDAGAIAAADAAVEKADTALKEAKKKEDEATAAKREAKKAFEDSSAAAAGASAALNGLSQSMLKMSEAAQQRADKSRSYRMSLLSEKREQERLKRESLAQVASLTSRLQASDDSKVIEESSQYALEMAVWAFANIYAALSNAKYFWDSMADYCERLSEPETTKLITREVRKNPEEKAKRITYYSNERFLQTAIFYLVRWKALETICNQYVTASEAARTKVINNIRKSPTIAEARAQLADLKKTLQAKLDDDMLQSKQRSEAIEAQQKLLQAVK